MAQFNKENPKCNLRQVSNHQFHCRKYTSVIQIFVIGFATTCIVFPKRIKACFHSKLTQTTINHAISSDHLLSWCGTVGKLRVPQVRLVETQREHQLHVFTPGVNPQNLKVDVDPSQRIIQIYAKANADMTPGDGNALYLDQHRQQESNSNVNHKAEGDSSDFCYMQQWYVEKSVNLADLVMAYHKGELTLSIRKTTVANEGHTGGHNQRNMPDGKQRMCEEKIHPKLRMSGPFSRSSTKPRPRIRGVRPHMVVSKAGQMAFSIAPLAPPGATLANLPASEAYQPVTHSFVRGVTSHSSISSTFDKASIGIPLEKKLKRACSLLHKVEFTSGDSTEPVLSQVAKTDLSQVSAEEKEYWFNKL